MEDLCKLTTNLSLKDKKHSTNNDILYPLKNHKYFNYQIEVAKWMNIQEKKNPNGFKGGIISLSMGLGKTLITLGYSLAHYKNRPTLIVVPKTILIEWKVNGVEKFFSDDKNVKVLYFHKDINKNIESLTLEDILKYQIVITTYSLCACTCLQGEYYLPDFERKSRLINLKKGRSLLYYIVWNRIVFDESHKCSNSSAKTFKYMMALSAKRKWCLTGTPIINYNTDIWSQFMLCGYQDILTQSEWKKNGLIIFSKQLKTSVYKLDYEDVKVELPPLHEKIINITLEGEHRALYDELLNRTRITYNKLLRLNKSYNHIFSWLIRLRQSAIAPYIISCEAKRQSSSIYIDTFGLNKIEHGIQSPKIVESLKLINNIVVKEKKLSTLYELTYNKVIRIYNTSFVNNISLPLIHSKKVVVFSNFITALDLLASALDMIPLKFIQLDGTTQDREEVLNVFKYSTDVNCLLTSYKVGSVGLNLTEATHCILLEPWWNNATLNQAKSRLWRIGQTKPVTIYNLIAKDTIEEHIIKICEKKDKMIESYFEGKNCNVSCTLTKKIVHDILYN